MAYLIDLMIDFRIEYSKNKNLTLQTIDESHLDRIWAIENCATVKKNWVPVEPFDYSAYDHIAIYFAIAKLNQNTPDAPLLASMAQEPGIKIGKDDNQRRVLERVHELQLKYPNWCPAQWLTSIIDRMKRKNMAYRDNVLFKDTFVYYFGAALFTAHFKANHTTIGLYNWIYLHSYAEIVYEFLSVNLNVLMKFDYDYVSQCVVNNGNPQHQYTNAVRTSEMDKYYKAELELALAIQHPQATTLGKKLRNAIFAPDIALNTITFKADFWMLNNPKFHLYETQYQLYQQRKLTKTITEIYSATTQQQQHQHIDNSVKLAQKIAEQRVRLQQNNQQIEYETKSDGDQQNEPDFLEKQRFLAAIHDEKYINNLKHLVSALIGQYRDNYDNFKKSYTINTNRFEVTFKNINIDLTKQFDNNSNNKDYKVALQKIMNVFGYEYNLDQFAINIEFTRIKKDILIFIVDFKKILYFFAFVSHMAQCKRIVPKIVLLPMIKKEDAFFQDATISNSRINTKSNGSQSNGSRGTTSSSIVKTKRASGISMSDLKTTVDKRLPTNLYKAKDKIFLHMPEDGIVVAKTLGDFSRSDYSDLMPGKDCQRMNDISARDIYLCILARDEDEDNSDWDSNATAREIVQAIKDQFESDRLDIPPPFTFRNLFPQWKRIANLINDGIVIKFSIPKGWRIVCKRLLKLICDSDLIYLEYDKYTLWELFQFFKQETLSKRMNFNYEKIEAVVHMYHAYLCCAA